MHDLFSEVMIFHSQLRILLFLSRHFHCDCFYVNNVLQHWSTELFKGIFVLFTGWFSHNYQYYSYVLEVCDNARNYISILATKLSRLSKVS